MPPKQRRRGRPKKNNNLANFNKNQKEAKEAADKAGKPAQQQQPITLPLDSPSAACAEAKTGTTSSIFRSVEEQHVPPSPQLGSGSTGTASRAPGDAAQPKGIFGSPKSRGRRKGEGGRKTAAATEAKVAQEGQNFVLNAPSKPSEPKFAPDSSGMYLPQQSNHGALQHPACPKPQAC